MKNRPTSDRSRTARLIAIAAAAVLLAVTAAGIAALDQNAAHAIHLPDARPTTSVQRAAPAARPSDWRPSASDASVPPASEVFGGRWVPGADDSATTF